MDNFMNKWRHFVSLLLVVLVVWIPVQAQSIISVSGKSVTVDVGSENGIVTGIKGYVFIHQVVSDKFVWVPIAKIQVTSVTDESCTATILKQKSKFELATGQYVGFGTKLTTSNPESNAKPEIKNGLYDFQIEKGENALFYFKKGNKCQSEMDFERAKRYFQRVLQDIPGDSAVKRELSRAENGIRETRAKADAKRKRRALLKNADELEKEGDKAAAAGNTDVAMQYYKRILRAVPTDPWILEKEADVLIAAGKKRKAKNALKKALSRYPELRNARSKLDNLIHKPGEKYVLHLPGNVRLKLVYIPAGNFFMGSPGSEKGHNKDESPRHKVIISRGFWMGKYEVTQAQWGVIMGKNPALLKAKKPLVWRIGMNNVPHITAKDLPVEKVSWNEVQKFICKLNSKSGQTFRLPTEAEWEYACRAGSKTAYYFGDNGKELSRYAWYNGNTSAETHPVGWKKPNGWGLYDMEGNVWEWCQDWYDENYYQYSPTTDPTGPSSGHARVFRGGSWFSSKDRCRSAFRYGYDPRLRYANLGFRLVMEISK